MGSRPGSFLECPESQFMTMDNTPYRQRAVLTVTETRVGRKGRRLFLPCVLFSVKVASCLWRSYVRMGFYFKIL